MGVRSKKGDLCAPKYQYSTLSIVTSVRAKTHSMAGQPLEKTSAEASQYLTNTRS